MTEERMTPALEACPFCGHKDIRLMIGIGHGDRGYSMLCGGCGIRQASNGRSKAEAIAAWNHRASPAPEPVAAMEPVADPLMDEVRDMLIRCAGEMSYVQGMLEAMEQSDHRRDTIARLNRTCDALGELFHKLGERK